MVGPAPAAGNSRGREPCRRGVVTRTRTDHHHVLRRQVAGRTSTPVSLSGRATAAMQVLTRGIGVVLGVHTCDQSTLGAGHGAIATWSARTTFATAWARSPASPRGAPPRTPPASGRMVRQRKRPPRVVLRDSQPRRSARVKGASASSFPDASRVIWRGSPAVGAFSRRSRRSWSQSSGLLQPTEWAVIRRNSRHRPGRQLSTSRPTELDSTDGTSTQRRAR